MSTSPGEVGSALGLTDKLWGSPIRRAPVPGSSRIYLTFDDGPEGGSTEAVLDRLAALGAPATFFLVANQARRAPGLVRSMRALGHSIGNHSLDHRYAPYFQGRARMLEWVRSSETSLSTLIGGPTVGFRPPAGIRTPELAYALQRLDLPLVLWDLRFFDAVIPWTKTRALRSIPRLRPGTIILLHDRQPPLRLHRFLEALTAFIESARGSGFELGVLRRDDLHPVPRRSRAQAPLVSSDGHCGARPDPAPRSLPRGTPFA